ncbi:hypothetical protein M947_03530 [Sulfurimonas hongkongensis]|uniref:Uncharacterized protein n=1 Tax=Sulfurimonas hongkongensis TaxID=1172190 RepID=T0JPK6_9BACT|nr:hypothetical protein [Sulfurimonas hongkongensis]EQB40106.1 hypothetical protein M947_03530 [Sulfurimonas hongkongensis]
MRSLILALLLTLSSFAADSPLDLEVKILEKIISEISINKEKIIWSDNKKLYITMEKKGRIHTTLECKKATIVILQDIKNLPKQCSNIIIFVLDYELLSQVPKSFGAFFWKKGRPNIVILKSRLKALSIQASSNLDPYLEEKIW